MAFTIEDFSDLVRLLDQHPEWRAELRRHVLSDELLELPTLMRQLIEAQARTEARVEALAEAQARTEARVDALTARVEALAEAQARTEARLDALTARVDDLTAQMAVLTARMDALVQQVAALVTKVGTIGDDLGTIKGYVLELRYRFRAPSYFARLARRIRVLDGAEFVDQLDEAVAQQVLAESERDALLLADLILSGRRREDQQEVYLLVEISFGIGVHDVQRAMNRASILAKLGRPVMPVVAGTWMNADAGQLAQTSGVWWVRDGLAFPPSEPDWPRVDTTLPPSAG